jgi:hypothetical protein
MVPRALQGTPCSSTPLLTTGRARGLADLVAAHDRNLTAVYITQQTSHCA